jgi:hypothetical protein
MSAQGNPSIAEQVEKVRALHALHEAAERQTSLARKEETRLLNEVNDAQRALDAMLAEIRLTAPRDSDWKRAAREARAERRPA